LSYVKPHAESQRHKQTSPNVRLASSQSMTIVGVRARILTLILFYV